MNLAINLTDIDYVVLSHEHYDHTGGLEYLDNKKVYACPDIFIPKYTKTNDQYKYVGIPYSSEYYEKENKIEFIDVQSSMNLTERIGSHINFKKQEPNGFYLKIDNNYTGDIFSDELVLSLNTNNGLVIVSGCAHSGIINIIEKPIGDNRTKNIYAFLDGFHLANLSQEKVKTIAEKISHHHINIIVISHCTGNKLASYLNGSNVFNFNVGDYLNMPF